MRPGFFVGGTRAAYMRPLQSPRQGGIPLPVLQGFSTDPCQGGFFDSPVCVGGDPFSKSLHPEERQWDNPGEGLPTVIPLAWVEAVHTAVIPAKAGIHFRLRLFASSFRRLRTRTESTGIECKNKKRILWIPYPDVAQQRGRWPLPSGEKSKWIPAFAGMTTRTENRAETLTPLPP